MFANAVYNAVACGIGHFRLVTQYVDDGAFDQEILIKRIQDPLSVFWAPGAVEPNRSDAEYCLVSELIGRKEFQKRFPDAAMTDFAATEDLNAESGLFWANRDAVRVCEYWVKRPPMSAPSPGLRAARPSTSLRWRRGSCSASISSPTARLGRTRSSIIS